MTESVVAPGLSEAAVEARRAQQRSLTESLRADFPHELNLAYGPLPRQVLDLYCPKQQVTGAPVLVWLHGGGFRQGAPAFDAYNARPYLERGALFASMGYRLAPELRFPDSCDDVELGLHWLVSNVQQRGGDPERIYLAGHSAGAMLAAAVGFHLDPIKGLVLISGFYEVSSHSDEVVNRASPRYHARQVDAIERLPAHTILIVGDNDAPAALPSARELQKAIESRGGSVEFFVEPNANHFAANRGFHTPGSEIATAVARMMSLS
jgi:arylformamidase